MEHSQTPHNGKIVIAPDVLVTIAKLGTLSIPGVARMAPVPRGLDRYVKRAAADGVQIVVNDHVIDADLYIVVQGGSDIRAVSEAVKAEVARAFMDMVGMETRAIHVHIEDVAYEDV